jgi:hypothetical protein
MRFEDIIERLDAGKAAHAPSATIDGEAIEHVSQISSQ